MCTIKGCFKNVRRLTSFLRLVGMRRVANPCLSFSPFRHFGVFHQNCFSTIHYFAYLPLLCIQKLRYVVSLFGGWVCLCLCQTGTIKKGQRKFQLNRVAVRVVMEFTWWEPLAVLNWRSMQSKAITRLLIFLGLITFPSPDRQTDLAR